MLVPGGAVPGGADAWVAESQAVEHGALPGDCVRETGMGVLLASRRYNSVIILSSNLWRYGVWKAAGLRICSR
jgi:hypothetical protein